MNNQQLVNFFMVKKKENLTPNHSKPGTGQITRAPIVVVLGHIDHGKSSILEAIKDFKITAKESGGITQHIGAYQIDHPSSGSGQAKKITFIDTPGHEAFSAMRARGAKIADIAILVIDSCEGAKAQTKEAISEIKKTGIPMIVALNKIDKPEANPEKVKRELMKEEVLVEKLGGKIPSVELSAKTGKGIPELLELILLVAEMEDLKTDISKLTEGVVIEAYLDNLRGPTATLILNQGKLILGQIIGTQTTLGRIKSLEDFQGNPVLEALPSQPVIVLGFEKVPWVGDQFKSFSDIETAKSYLKKIEKKTPEVFSIEPEQRVLNLILKTDCLGSIEGIEGVLKGLPREEVILRVLKSEVGEVNETDLKLAQSARAKILSFRAKINPIAKMMSERGKIRIIKVDVIYDLVEEVRNLITRLTKPEVIRTDLGKVKILAIFGTEKNRQTVGGKVIEGEVKKGALIEILRGEESVGGGKLVNLQQNKKDVDGVPKGSECGILYEGEVKIEEGDILNIFQEEKRKEG